MIVLVAVLFRLFVRKHLIDKARVQADRGLAGSMEGHAARDIVRCGRGLVLGQAGFGRGFTAVAHVFVMEWHSRGGAELLHAVRARLRSRAAATTARASGYSTAAAKRSDLHDRECEKGTEDQTDAQRTPTDDPLSPRTTPPYVGDRGTEHVQAQEAQLPLDRDHHSGLMSGHWHATRYSGFAITSEWSRCRDHHGRVTTRRGGSAFR